MSNFIKPQTPIYNKSTDNYIYPLTTADQVIMKDGSRLENIHENTINKINDLANKIAYNGSKNLLRNTAKSQTVNGITFTVNNDGSITANGTVTDGNSAILYITQEMNLQAGTYVVGNCDEIEDGMGYIQFANPSIEKYVNVIGTEKAYILDNDTNDFYCAIVLSEKFTASNLTFYPMIRHADTDGTYEPYYEGLKDLTDRGMELLWENANPTNEFAAQTITLDLSEYSFVLIYYWYNTNTYYSSIGCVPIDNTSNYYACNAYRGWNQNGYYIILETTGSYIYKDKIEFTDHFVAKSNSFTTDNTVCAPRFIYGIKGIYT